MKRLCMILLAGSLLLSACNTETGLKVHDPWIQSTAQEANGAVYFVLHNHTDQDDELTGVTADVAEAVEIHQSTIDPATDIMKMDMVSSIPIPAGSEIFFEPGKYHLMLIRLKKELKVGDHIGVILHFKNHEDMIVNVSVQDNAPEEDHSH
jgi:periplasmic copper chaperone A